MTALHTLNCQPPEQWGGPMDAEHCQSLMAQLHPDWVLDLTHPRLSRTVRWQDYYQTMAFVNALAWVAHQQDHHPDLEVGYNRCTVHFSTHAVGGLSQNDFICAARMDALLISS